MKNLEQGAREFATRAHSGQKRKYTGEDYIVHPAAVVEIVRTVPHTPDMLAAAWLHDVVEDCGVTRLEIQNAFGYFVAHMVGDLTDVSTLSDGNRAARKAIDRDHTARAWWASKTIKLADLIHNTISICEHDLGFAKVYMAEKRLLLDVLAEGDPMLFARAWGQVEDFHRLAQKVSE
jgi:guanosine-3',5'-bis(diphosphate) 3'-pyrophosphohydrolase